MTLLQVAGHADPVSKTVQLLKFFFIQDTEQANIAEGAGTFRAHNQFSRSVRANSCQIRSDNRECKIHFSM